jgi:hypothetical protein
MIAAYGRAGIEDQLVTLTRPLARNDWLLRVRLEPIDRPHANGRNRRNLAHDKGRWVSSGDRAASPASSSSTRAGTAEEVSIPARRGSPVAVASRCPVRVE